MRDAGSMLAVLVEHPCAAADMAVAATPRPFVGPGEVLVRVRAAALNYADMKQRSGEWPAPPGESSILGVEVAGDIVTADGEDETEIGRAVCALVGGGGYAQYCAVDRHMLMPIPSGLTYAEAAALPEVFLTAHRAVIELAELAPGERVLVHGGGSGVGTACSQLAIHAGARVACTVGTQSKARKAMASVVERAIVRGPGPEHFDEVLAWSDGAGVDAVIDIAGASHFAGNLRVLGDGGRLIEVGCLSGSQATIDIEDLILRRLQIKGTIMRPLPIEEKRSLKERFLRRWSSELAAGRVRPVIDRIFPFGDVCAAHDYLAEGAHFGKIVLDIDRASEHP